jgi:NO-binding membrane sensor protein with MHYT domain
MLTVYAFNIKLLLGACGIGWLGCYVALRLSGRARPEAPVEQVAWVTGASLCFSAAVWTTHFVALLACDYGIPAHFDLLTTATSFVLVFLPNATALLLRPALNGSWGAHFGCAVLTVLGIQAMHWCGMSAIDFAWAPNVDAGLVGGTTALAIGMTTLVIARRPFQGLGVRSMLLFGAVGLVHFGAVFAQRWDGLALPMCAVSTDATPFGGKVLIVALVICGLAALVVRSDERANARREHTRARDALFAGASSEGMLLVEDGQVVDGNLTVERLLGLRLSALHGRAVEAFLPGYGADSGQQNMNRAEIIRADGRRIPVAVYQRTALTLSGRPRRVIVIHEIGRRPNVAAAEPAGHAMALAGAGAGAA